MYRVMSGVCAVYAWREMCREALAQLHNGNFAIAFRLIVGKGAWDDWASSTCCNHYSAHTFVVLIAARDFLGLDSMSILFILG